VTLSAQKDALRLLIREKSRAISPEARAEASQELVQQLLQQPRWLRAQTVLLYLPFPSEPDLRALFESAWFQRKQTALLRHQASDDSLQPCQVQNLSTDLKTDGKFGQAEPADHCPVLLANQLDLLLIPGVAFSWSGSRLGRGQGYYDRFLKQATGVTVGVAFDWQMMAEVPTEPHDVGVQCVATPKRWQEVTARRGL
jgi:5-formyltetrahydrofolate cyclo-ligase